LIGNSKNLEDISQLLKIKYAANCNFFSLS
jgi:hypothetical protein